MYDYFISYSSSDLIWAEWLYKELDQLNKKATYDKKDFRPGFSLVGEIEQGLQIAERAILIISTDYFKSSWCVKEWSDLFRRHRIGETGRILPIVVRDVDVPEALLSILHISFVGLNPEDRRIKLKEALAKIDQNETSTQDVKVADPNVRSTLLPPVCNLPQTRNPAFTGRSSELEELERSLQDGEPTVITNAISGLGGIGKSELALEYAYRNISRYSLIWWLRSEQTELLIADCESLASALQFPTKEWEDHEELIRDLHSYLGRSKNWLLVFDNAFSVEAVRQFLPDKGQGHTILTSRNPSWGSVAKQLDIDILSVEDATSFLIKRTGLEDHSHAELLAKELGCLPLALEQAAAYVLAKGRSLAEYLSLYRELRPRLLEKKDSERDYPNSLATTWSMSFSEIRETSSAAAATLFLFALLSPDVIPRGIIETGRKELLPPKLAGVAGDEIELDETIGLLRKYSLIKFTPRGFSIHRLVQAVVRDSISNDELVLYSEIAQRLILEEITKSTRNSEDELTYELVSNTFAIEIHMKKLWNKVNYPPELYEKIGRFITNCGAFGVNDNSSKREARKFMDTATLSLRPDLEGRANMLAESAFYLEGGYSLLEAIEMRYCGGPDGSVKREDAYKHAKFMLVFAKYSALEKQVVIEEDAEANGCFLNGCLIPFVVGVFLVIILFRIVLWLVHGL